MVNRSEALARMAAEVNKQNMIVGVVAQDTGLEAWRRNKTVEMFNRMQESTGLELMMYGETRDRVFLIDGSLNGDKMRIVKHLKGGPGDGRVEVKIEGRRNGELISSYDADELFRRYRPVLEKRNEMEGKLPSNMYKLTFNTDETYRKLTEAA